MTQNPLLYIYTLGIGHPMQNEIYGNLSFINFFVVAVW